MVWQNLELWTICSCRLIPVSVEHQNGVEEVGGLQDSAVLLRAIPCPVCHTVIDPKPMRVHDTYHRPLNGIAIILQAKVLAHLHWHNIHF